MKSDPRKHIRPCVSYIESNIAKQLTLKKSTPYDRAALELPEGFWWAYPMTVPMVTDKYFTTIIQENKIDSQ